MSGATDGCGTRVVGRDHEQRIKALEAEVERLRAHVDDLEAKREDKLVSLSPAPVYDDAYFEFVKLLNEQ